MPAFHETVRGARFFDVTLPRICDELANLNNNLAALVVLLRERATTEPATPAPTSTEPTART